MGIFQIGSNYKPIPGYTMFLDSTIPESYNSSSGNTWTNLVGNGSNCTLYNAPTYTSIASGANVLSFNGSNQYGVISTINLRTSFTMIFWAMKNSASGNCRLFGGGETSNANFTEGGMGVTFGVDGTTLMADTFRAYGTSEYTAGGTITPGKWHHMAAVLDSSVWTVYLYLDTVLVASGGFYTAKYALTDSLFRNPVLNYIGQRTLATGNYWNGSISQAKIYTDTIHTQAQLIQHYNQTKTRYGR